MQRSAKVAERKLNGILTRLAKELADLAKDIIYLSADFTNRYKLYKSAAVRCFEGFMKLI